MDADSVGQSHLIEFPKLVLDGLAVKFDDEFLLAATVQNLRRLAKLAAIPPPPIPNAA